MTARLMQRPDEPDTRRPDIRLDRETWDGRLQVEWISAKGREAFRAYGKFNEVYGPRVITGTWTKDLHDRCLREFIAAEGLRVEGE